MYKFSFSLLFLFVITGCADYKWGNRWEASETTSWKTPEDRDGNSLLSQSQCNEDLITLSVRKYHGSSIMAPFFIPMFKTSEEPQTQLQIFVDYENVRELCSQYGNDMFEIKFNNKVTNDYSVAFNENKYGRNKCSINLNVPKDQDRVVTLSFKEEILGCKSKPLTIFESGYFCIKPTEFGGSGYCGY